MRNQPFARDTTLGRSVVRSSLSPWLCAPALLAACAHSAAAAIERVGEPVAVCATRVIVSFTEEQGATPSPELITRIEHEAAVQLHFVRATGPHLYVFSLSATDGDPSCSEALMRLRRNVRIRSADVDARRHALE